MSMFTRKTIEICFFIADCMVATILIAAFLLEVYIPVFAEVALVCVPALCTGWAAMGGVRKRIRFLKSVSIYDKERVAINILTVAMIFLALVLKKPMDVVISMGLSVWNVGISLIFLCYLFAPERLHLSADSEGQK